MLASLAVLSLIALLVGLDSPSFVLPARIRSKRNVVRIYGALFLVFAVGSAFTYDPSRRAESRRARVEQVSQRPTSRESSPEHGLLEITEDQLQSEQGSQQEGEEYLFVNGYMVTVGMTADLLFEILGPNDVISQTVVDDPEIDDSLIVTKLYGDGTARLEIEFRREEYDGPYLVTRIVVHHW